MTADEATGDTIELSLPLDGEAAEAVCELFERHGGGAVVETRMMDGVEDGANLAQPEHWVRTYIPAHDVEARARIEVGLWYLSRIHPMPEATIRRLSEANWAEAWKAHFTPLRIGAHFLIVPSWLEAEVLPGDLVISLDPGTAFGTGLHPTTRLCLSALEDLVTPGSTVLDVGTGSGILAIGACLLDAGRVVAVDIAPSAVETAADNAAANGVSIEAVAGELDVLPPERFDVVVANLLATTCTELAAQFASRVRPGGLVVTSGILVEQADDVASALELADFESPEVRRDGDWVALVASRPAHPMDEAVQA